MDRKLRLRPQPKARPLKISLCRWIGALAPLVCFSISTAAYAQKESRTDEEAGRVLVEAVATALSKPRPVQEALLRNIYRAYSVVGDFDKAVQSVSSSSERARLDDLGWILRDAAGKRGVNYAQDLLKSWQLDPKANENLAASLAWYAVRELDFEEGIKIVPDGRHYINEQFRKAWHVKDFAKAKRILSFMDDRERASNTGYLAVSMAEAGLVNEALDEIAALRDVEFHAIAARIGMHALERDDLALARRIALLLLDPPSGTPGVELSGRASSWGMLGGCPGTWKDEWSEKGNGPVMMYPIADCRLVPPIMALNFAIALHRKEETGLAARIVDRFRRYALLLAQRLPELAKEQHRLPDFTLGPPGAYMMRTLAALVATGNTASARMLAEAMFVTPHWAWFMIAESIGETGDAAFLKQVLEYGSANPLEGATMAHGLYGLLKSGHLEAGWRWASQYQQKLPSHYALSAAHVLFRSGVQDKAKSVLDFIERNEHLFDTVSIWSWIAIGDGRRQMRDKDGAVRAYRRAFDAIVNYADDRAEGNGWPAAYIVWQLNNLGASLAFEDAAAQLKNIGVRQRFYEFIAELELVNGRFAAAQTYRDRFFDNRESVATPPNALALIAFDRKKVDRLARHGYLTDALRANFRVGDEYGQADPISNIVSAWSQWHYRQAKAQRPN